MFCPSQLSLGLGVSQVSGNEVTLFHFSAGTNLLSVSAQRRAYKVMQSGSSGSAAMTSDRATKLQELGFEWEALNPNNVPWDVRYEELLAFVVSSLFRLRPTKLFTWPPLRIDVGIQLLLDTRKSMVIVSSVHHLANKP
jgi:hypothetical protein